MNCCSNGLGQFDPLTLTAINSAFTHAQDLWRDIAQIFGIGAGAREADVITPLQDQIHQTVLAPAAEFTADPDGHTCAEFQQMLGAINSAERQFRAFILTPNEPWKDGRAAQQALWWLTGTEGTQNNQQPWFKIITDDFRAAMLAKGCGSGSIGDIFTTPEGGYNWPLIAGVGAVALMLFKKK